MLRVFAKKSILATDAKRTEDNNIYTKEVQSRSKVI
jgi:hypothetical protein